jgi:hypothetical protein
MRRTSADGIKPPHFGYIASSDARTFSRLIFRELTLRKEVKGVAFFFPRFYRLAALKMVLCNAFGPSIYSGFISVCG